MAIGSTSRKIDYVIRYIENNCESICCAVDAVGVAVEDALCCAVRRALAHKACEQHQPDLFDETKGSAE